MTQATPIIGSGKSGLEYRGLDNSGKQALLNHHKGASAPSYAEAGTLWLDDTATPWLLKMHDGADWITLAAVNATANAVTPYHGGGALKLLGYAADTGAANAYAVAPAPAITAYAAGQVVTLKPGNANTGASTLAVNGLSAAAVKMPDGADLPAGALKATGVYLLAHNGTSFVLVNAALSSPQLLHAQDQKASGTDGGTFSLGGWTQRALNTAVVSGISGASLSSNQVILPAGTYELDAAATAHAVNNHRVRWRNMTDSADTLLGLSEYAGTAASTTARVTGKFTITTTKTFELQHRCSATQATNGYGRAAAFSVLEVYADVRVWKLS